jgi:hypothetical protein
MDNFFSLNKSYPYVIISSSIDEEHGFMVSERVNILFKMLDCGNTDIARFAGCTSGNISKLKTGTREPLPASRTIISFANGVYGYADYENLLPALQELCGVDDASRESVVPALIAWLYGSDEVVLPDHIAEPKSKRMLVLSRQQFGDRLDRAVTMLGLSNSAIAGYLNIDISLISRYRSGIYSPLRNKRLSEKLSELLFSHAKKIRKTKELARLCGTDEAHLDTDTVWAWLFAFSTAGDSSKALALMQSLDELTQPEDILDYFETLPEVPEAPDAPEETYYYGLDGRRKALSRFLNDAAREGGELYMYSDEPSDIVLGENAYFKLWTSMMENCVKHGVKIKIIHNIDRDNTNITKAINRWAPLYVSGMIEPYAFREKRDVRFYHTIFLRPGSACIHGFFPVSSENRWYEYITDPARLEILKSEFDSMLSVAMPIMKVFSSGNNDDHISFAHLLQKSRLFLLTTLPVFTIPERLLERIISRIDIEEPLKKYLLNFCSGLRKQFRSLLKSGTVNMILCASEDHIKQNRNINFSFDLINLQVAYTQEEYAEHIAAIIDLVKSEKNFHLTLLPKHPAKEIQVVLTDNAASLIYCRSSITALIFYDPEMKESLSSWFSEMFDLYSDDRQIILEKLEKLRHLGIDET